MEPTIGWFVTIASLSSLAWAGGYYLGKRSSSVARATLLAGLACMGVWVWLHYHPAVAVKLIPVTLLSRIEGVGSVPIFMLLLGLAWARAQLPRQKRVISWAIMFGAVFFIHGGMWMLQSTPEQGFASTVSAESIRQSQEYSCVPAASAHALTLLGFPTSEKYMARLSQTRPGTGSTMIRAMQGLKERLKGTPYTVELLEVKPEELRYMPYPILTTFRYEPTQFHMVTITDVTDTDVMVADPIEGTMKVSWNTLDMVFSGQVLVFVRR
jgi:predicted double-glycine peptidase